MKLIPPSATLLLVIAASVACQNARVPALEQRVSSLQVGEVHPHLLTRMLHAYHFGPKPWGL